MLRRLFVIWIYSYSFIGKRLTRTNNINNDFLTKYEQRAKKNEIIRHIQELFSNRKSNFISSSNLFFKFSKFRYWLNEHIHLEALCNIFEKRDENIMAHLGTEPTKLRASARQYFSSSLLDLKEGIHNIRIFDEVNEINVFCDDLESQVILSVDSAIKHLNQISTSFISKIDEQKNALLKQDQITFEHVSHPVFPSQVFQPPNNVSLFFQSSKKKLFNLVNDLVFLKRLKCLPTRPRKCRREWRIELSANVSWNSKEMSCFWSTMVTRGHSS